MSAFTAQILRAGRGPVMIRVRWADSAGAFTAQTMVPVRERQEASSTSSAEHAAKRAAAKHYGLDEAEIVFVRGCKPGASITAVGKEWTAFQFALKGSETQTELFNAGGAS